MATLARHFETIRDRSNRDLIVLFDIDGTILDHRYVIYDILNAYDREHGTDYFQNLTLSDIKIRENSIDKLLDRIDLPDQYHNPIIDYFHENRWSEDVLLRSHRPFQGVMDVIRWFQLQPETHVGLNTARPEPLRQTTLKSLNRLGSEYKVTFRDSLLHMNDNDWSDAEESKIEGIKYFQDNDYRIVAMIDNEPENLAAIDNSGVGNDLLLLHADNFLDTGSSALPDGSISGENYRLSELISGQSGAEHITLIRDGLDHRAGLQDFKRSPIHWGNLTVREAPRDNRLIIRQDSFKENPVTETDERFFLDEALDLLENLNKGILFDSKISPKSLDHFLTVLEDSNLDTNNLGFRIELGQLRHQDISTLRTHFPEARFQLAVNFLSDVILGEEDKAKYLLRGLKDDWGIDEFSMDWQVFRKRDLLDTLREWNFKTNIRNVPNLEQYLNAALLLPDSITVDLGANRLNTPSTPDPGKVF
jgi:hypothetical protein